MPHKHINQLKSFVQEGDPRFETVEATIAQPGSPLLAVFCCAFAYVPVFEPRQGNEQEHGKKRWFPCEPQFFAPVSVVGTTYRFEFPRCLCSEQGTCYWNIVELGAPPILEWSSLPHRCLPCPPVTGTWQQSISKIQVGGAPYTDMFGVIDLIRTGDVIGASAPPSVWPAVHGNSIITPSVEALLTSLGPGEATAQIRIIHQASGAVIGESDAVTTTDGTATITVPGAAWATPVAPLTGQQIRVQSRGFGAADGDLRSTTRSFIGTARSLWIGAPIASSATPESNPATHDPWPLMQNVLLPNEIRVTENYLLISGAGSFAALGGQKTININFGSAAATITTNNPTHVRWKATVAVYPITPTTQRATAELTWGPADGPQIKTTTNTLLAEDLAASVLVAIYGQSDSGRAGDTTLNETTIQIVPQ